MNYTKTDAKMTQGFAIICMLMLHLFCRTGDNVYGTPLLWINDETPVVYLFGFFSEICVSVYSICAGYAQFVLLKQKRLTYKSNIIRVFKLLCNYWIVLIVFSAIAIIRGSDCGIEVTPSSFIMNVFLLKSYNGAWWFLHSYVYLLLIPPNVLMWFAKRINVYIGFVICFAISFGCYFTEKTELINNVSNGPFFQTYIVTEIWNLIKILPPFFIGALLCKACIIQKISKKYEDKTPEKAQKWILCGLFIFAFVLDNALHKSALTLFFAVLVFILFNIWHKSKTTERVFLFLGDHSTNIWLCHMFFYARVFPDLVFIVKYPVLIFLFLLLLCIITSYFIKGLLELFTKIILILRTRRKKGIKNN